MTEERETSELPAWLLLTGFIAITGTMILAGRLVFEQTVWTWETGEQMVGFSLAHGYAGSLFIAPIVMIVWLLIAIALMVRTALKKKRIAPSSRVAVAMALAVLGILLVPYTTWERIFIKRLASGPHASDFALGVALSGDVGSLRYYLAHGVPVNARGYAGKTPLHAAAFGGHLEAAKYLVEQGADVNAIDMYGDSPMEVAVSEQHTAVADYLAGHGATRVRGDGATRGRATELIVGADMARDDRDASPTALDSIRRETKRFLDSLQLRPKPPAARPASP